MLVCAVRPAGWEDAFARLSAPSTLERAAAQRELAAGLAREHAPRLAQLLRGADEEQRARVAAALGGQSRHLGLALLVAADPDRRVARTGVEALEAACLASVVEVRDTTEGEEYEWLLPRAGLPVRLDGALQGAATPELVAVLVASGDAALRVAVDPDAPDARTPLPRTEGDLVLWLAALTSARGLRHDIYVDEEGGGLVVLGAPADETPRPASLAALRARWLRAAAAGEDLARRRRACAALAASGWPAALEWLRAVAAAGDDLALEELCGAAQAGRGGRELGGFAGAARTRERLAAGRLAALEQGDAARATLCTRGLAALGALDPARRWPEPAADARLLPHQLLELRLAPLSVEGLAGAEREPPLLGAAWSAPDAPTGLVLAAWRTAAAHGVRVPREVRRLHGARLAADLAQAGCIDAAVELAAQVGLLPPEEPAQPLDWRYELALRLAQGEREAAQRLLAPQAAQDVCAAAWALRAVEQRLDAAGAARAQALRLDAAWIAAPAGRETWLRLQATRELAREELGLFTDLEAALAVVAGRPEQAVARRMHVELCGDPARSSRRLAEAGAAILEQLEAAGRHELAAQHLAAMRAAAATVRSHAAALQPGRFPPPSGAARAAAWHDLQPGRSFR